MDTVTLVASAFMAGQYLVFEGTNVTARYVSTSFPVPGGRQQFIAYDWAIGTQALRTWGRENAGGSSFITVGQEHVGLQVSVTATPPGTGGMPASSTRALSVVNVNDLPAGSVRVEGDTRTAGSLLKAVASISDEDGLGALRYVWRADGQEIAGAASDTLVLGTSEAGKTITVAVHYVDAFGQAESVASDVPDAPAHLNSLGIAGISGSVEAGHRLQASVLDPDHAGKIYYQWQGLDAGGSYRNIDGAWNSGYLVGAVPSVLRVLTIYADRYGTIEWQATALGTEGMDTLYGEAGMIETILAYGGNDRIVNSGRGDRIDGGAGIDTFVLTEARHPLVQVAGKSGEWALRDGLAREYETTLVNIERVLFAGGAIGVALDFDGHAGQAYRLYQAAFDRKSDAAGIGFWISQLDHGASLRAIADGFVASAEFRQIYGVAPSNAEIVTKFYEHVLHRAPDSGSQFWVDILDRAAATVADVLVGFSESAENMAALVGVREQGIEFIPYGAGGGA